MKEHKFDRALIQALQAGIDTAEDRGYLVSTTPNHRQAAEVLAEQVKAVYAGGVMSPDEVLGICSVLYHAAEDKKFFDWEMPALCGYKPEEIKHIADRLRQSIKV